MSCIASFLEAWKVREHCTDTEITEEEDRREGKYNLAWHGSPITYKLTAWQQFGSIQDTSQCVTVAYIQIGKSMWNF